MLLVFAEKITPRLSFISKLIFKGLLGVEFEFTSDKESYLASDSPKLCYAKSSFDSGLFLQASHLLFESSISDQNPKKTEYEGEFVFFQTGPRSDIPYDPLAASFYLISRYEEYLPFIADEHNRFPAKQSFAFKNGVLQKPLVNIYAGHIESLLKEKYPNLKFTKPSYKFINTVDIDNAFAFKGKGLVRTLGGFGKDLIGFNIRESISRLRSVFGLNQDPFSTFDYQQSLQDKYNYKTIYFALFGAISKYDRSLSLQSLRLHRHLKSINDFCDMGIHPSYRSNSDFKIAQEEHKSLEEVLNRTVTKSRQHFLKMRFPQTYRNLLDMDITDEYSMGYADEVGFRAGICSPFRFYDLEYEVETPLVVHPFSFMDGTFIYYQKKSKEEAWEDISRMIAIHKKYNGQFIPIWHYRVFSEKNKEWQGWNSVFEKMVSAAV